MMETEQNEAERRKKRGPESDLKKRRCGEKRGIARGKSTENNHYEKTKGVLFKREWGKRNDVKTAFVHR